MRAVSGPRDRWSVRLLGTVSARIDGEDGEAAPSGVRLRGLLARLALDAGRPVGVAALVDDLWGDAPPEAAANALQSLVSRLRRALGADRVTTTSGGYRIELDADRVDALRFAALRAEAAAQADPGRAVELLGAALGLWTGGPALADVRDLPFAGPAATRLAEARASAIEELADRGSACGEPTVALEALSGLLAEQPLRESAAVALARTLTATGRQADALAVLDRTRDALADELGVDPGPELARTRMAVLRGDATPAPAPRAAHTNGAAPTPVPARDTGRARRPVPALTSFVGREADVERLRTLLRSSRLVTVIGPGGAGKTRLALEAVGSLDPEAVAVAALAPLTAADEVVRAVLHAAGGPQLVVGAAEAPSDPAERLTAALAGRDVVLVLDNCEHLIDAVAALVEGLLETIPGLQVLATSREPLAITGEILHPLGALPAADAVRLFVDRAAAVRPGFEPTGEDAATVAEICRRLDGQPLPIELAAARVRTLSPSEIAARLDDRFRLLTSGSRTALPRHQTLRAVVDWSWELLTPDERRLAARLGVFAGPVEADAIEAVCDDESDGEVFDVLTALVDKSLLIALPDADGGPTRYLMLETIREYAATRLAESGERERLELRHADWALRVAETAEPGLRTPDQLVHLATIRRTEGEIVRALRWAVAAGDGGRAHRLLAAMSWGWAIRGEMTTLQRHSEEVWTLPVPPGCESAEAVNRTVRAMLRVAFASTEGPRPDLDALAVLVPSLPEPRHPIPRLAAPVAMAFSELDDSGLVELVDSTSDRWLRGLASQVLASLAENVGDVERQRRMLRAAHADFTAIGDRFGLGMTVMALGELEDRAGEMDAARALYLESVGLSRELGGSADDTTQYMMRLASLAVRTGDPDAAEAYLREAERHQNQWSPATSAFWWLGVADIERRRGNLTRARELADAAAAIPMEEPGPGLSQREAYMKSLRAAVRLDLGETAAAGRLLDEASVAALASIDGPVIAMVAEGSARCALAVGDVVRAAELLGVATARRGLLNVGEPDVVAVRDTVRAALGEDGAADAIARGAALPRDHPVGPTV